MSRIVPKLNLNKTPQIVENNSLMFSKNIKLLTDNTFSNDSSIKNIITDNSTLGVVIGYIVGVNSKIYFFVNDDNVYKIKEYDEIYKTISVIDCAWTYSGGKITGCVTVNNTGEYILTIAEYFDDNISNLEHNVPIKHINLSQCNSSDDESIYTQHPNLPITNLKLVGYYNNAIPAGVYQFFIRYEIRKDFYTAWMPCSKELFAINQNTVSTIQGTLLYNDVNKESNKSFIFNLENLIPNNLNIYKRLQLGFIISRDNGSFARSWKHFKIEDIIQSPQIMFSFDNNSIEEIDINDLTASNYELFNVKNVISYKNKLFISNYKETNFNDYDNCRTFAENIDINLNIKKIHSVQQNIYYLNDREIEKGEGDLSDYFVSFNDTNQYQIKDVYSDLNYNKVTDLQRNDFAQGPEIIVTEESPYPVFYNRAIYAVSLLFADGSTDLLYGTSMRPGSYYTSETSFRTTENSQFEDVINGTIGFSGIKTRIIGLNENSEWIAKDSNDNKKVLVGFSYGIQNLVKIRYTGAVLRVTVKHSVVKYRMNLINNVSNKSFTNVDNTCETLLPFTNYDFYCHLVKSNGITTNGFYIGSKKINRYCELDYDNIVDAINPNHPKLNIYSDTIINGIDIDKILVQENINRLNLTVTYPGVIDQSSGPYAAYGYFKELVNNAIIYPTFTPSTNLPNGYVGYFISMYKHENNVAQGSNIRSGVKFDCLELDASIYNFLEDIEVRDFKGNVLTKEAKYISSGTNNPIQGFGSFGYVYFPDSTPSIVFDENDNLLSNTLWIIGNPNTVAENNKRLIKLTPYILGNESYLDYRNQNLQGYLCNISKLTEKDDYYISDADIYDKTYGSDSDNNPSIDLDIINDKVYIRHTGGFIVHSNFNLSCLSLTEELFPKIRTYEETINEGTNEESTITKSQVIFAVNSLIASYIFKLEETFKTYVRRTYSKYNEDNLVVFNNTIRSSNIDVDETYRNIYRFDATDYYNVPTNRGIIINLFSILNNIYIHTEHSLFKFVDNKQLASEDGNVLLQESNVFDTGIQEAFDAQYGHGGLYKKEHSLINYEYYIFYDKLAKTIYAYNGESDLVIISDPIKKLMKHFDADDILFAGDNYNDRFFINLRRTRKIDNVETIENVCLSYNLKAKSFISIHDIDFDESFNSRINTYFLQQGTPTNVFKIDNDSALEITNYSGVFKSSYLKCSDIDSYNEANSVASCIDIIYNQDYEIIKNLDYINWICRAIENYADNDYNLAEEIGSKYSGTAVRIYTDETKSEIIHLVDNNGVPLEANNQSIRTSESYQYPRYNCGIWSLNYFRDVKNRTDDFNYNEKVPLPNARDLYQEDSLLYGKYFIVRFIFKNKNFKLENIKLSLRNYDKA